MRADYWTSVRHQFVDVDGVEPVQVWFVTPEVIRVSYGPVACSPLIAINAYNRDRAGKIVSLTSPALGAGIGAMPFERVARQMRAVYADVVLGETD